ncbi:MAG TPA: tetratricopeptide repeat protein [Chitinophagaceae bacterium]|jgi:tetratricopeptide (TPR) repeat protein|nr:tetratricopeptide repeat protein [Chitinophagaceae bacterium]
MKKSAIVLFFTALFSISAFAQNIQEGVSHVYAERYQSAKAIFDKMVASNPNNIEANYWLGQTLIRMKDTAGAQAQYQKLLAANGNAPLALVGMGQLDLIMGRTAEAKQRFETAINLSRGKKGNDANVLLAIGRANTDAKGGDIAYAIQKLNEAAQLAPNNAEVFLALGNAYRKIPGSGSQAATNYLRAGGLNPSFAMPYYRLAKLYSTQLNWEVVVENLNKALTADPKFAPAYLDLYYYYLLYPKDFAKAEEFANKYISSADKSVENDYIKAQTAFVQNKYDVAISTAQNIISQAGDRSNPRVYRLLGYSFVGKGDSTTACNYVDQFFAKADPDDIIGADYILQADACGKDNPDIVRASYLKAAQMDSVLYNQIRILNEGIERFKNSGRKIAEGDLRLLSYQLRGDKANPAELFQIGLPFYQGRNFKRADSVFSAYATAMPDSIYGHYWTALARAQMDTTMEQGLAVSAYQKTLEVAEKDPVRFRSQGVASAGYLAGYHNNIKKDKETAIEYLKKGLEFDPTNTALQNGLKALQAPPARSAPAKTSTSSNAAKQGSSAKKPAAKK